MIDWIDWIDMTDQFDKIVGSLPAVPNSQLISKGKITHDEVNLFLHLLHFIVFYKLWSEDSIKSDT